MNRMLLLPVVAIIIYGWTACGSRIDIEELKGVILEDWAVLNEEANAGRCNLVTEYSIPWKFAYMQLDRDIAHMAESDISTNEDFKRRKAGLMKLVDNGVLAIDSIVYDTVNLPNTRIYREEIHSSLTDIGEDILIKRWHGEYFIRTFKPVFEFDENVEQDERRVYVHYTLKDIEKTPAFDALYVDFRENAEASVGKEIVSKLASDDEGNYKVYQTLWAR